MDNKITGVLDFWTIWTVEHPDEEHRQIFERHRPGLLPQVLTARVVVDNEHRWSPESAMRSSLLRGFDLQNLTVHTENSIYQLRGPGRFLEGYPTDYAEAVGQAMVAVGLRGQINSRPPERWLKAGESIRARMAANDARKTKTQS